MADKPSVVGVSGSSYLPPVLPTSAGVGPLPAAAWFTFTPSPLTTSGSACERFAVVTANARMLPALMLEIDSGSGLK